MSLLAFPVKLYRLSNCMLVHEFTCPSCRTVHAAQLQTEQHKWAEEGAALKGRLSAHESQLDLMQVNIHVLLAHSTKCLVSHSHC